MNPGNSKLAVRVAARVVPEKKRRTNFKFIAKILSNRI